MGAQVFGVGAIALAAPAETPGIREEFVRLPVEPTREIRWELDRDWEGELPLPKRKVLKGARVKPVVFVPEERAAELDRNQLRDRILAAGAVYCKAPEVHVLRKKVKRDERHAAELEIRESLGLFAKETRVRDAKEKIRFAEALAAEADEGVKE